MAKYKAYPEYKDSGVEWIGCIPKHWMLSKVKYLSPFQVGWTPPTGDSDNFLEENLWANISDLRSKHTFETKKYIADSAVKKASMSITPRGSLMYSFKLSVGAVSFAGVDMYTNEAIASFLNNNNNPLCFLYYALPVYIEKNSSVNIYGAKILNQELIRNAVLPKIGYEESLLISKFLDHETAKIDKLIEKQKQLIELLNEKRQAVISQAVTKGLDPSVPMKDSGVEWLGDVPEHWSVTRVGFLAKKIGSGSTPRGGAESYVDEGVLFLRSQNIYNDGLRILPSESVYIPIETHKTMLRTQVQGGDVLLNITGGSIGRSCLVPSSFQEANVNQHVCILRFPPESRVFLSYVFKSTVMQEQIQNSQVGGNREGLNFEQISKFSFCMPDDKELLSIVEHIDAFTKNLDKSIQCSQEMIELLYERRTSLISAAVTGKIDVRDVELT